MATAGFDLSEPELTAADVLVLEDSYFDPDTVAVVTGAASGIGRATTVALAMNGLTVVGVGVDEDGLAETTALAGDLEAPGEIVSVPTDLTDDGDVESIVETAADAGDLRFVANVAGMQHIASIDQIEDTVEERGISEREVVEDVMLGQARTKEMMTPVEVANPFTFGFSARGKHLNGGETLWGGGYTRTYE